MEGNPLVSGGLEIPVWGPSRPRSVPYRYRLPWPAPTLVRIEAISVNPVDTKVRAPKDMEICDNEYRLEFHESCSSR